MTTTQQPPMGVTRAIDRLRISGPAEILQAVPFLLGFRPERSVVLLGLAPPRRRLMVTARFDLDAPTEVAEPWFAAANREGCDECLVVLYDDAFVGRPLDHQDQVDVWETMAGQYSMTMTDALAVGDDRWWSYLCSNRDCCPNEGIPLVQNGRVAAAAVSYGMVAASDRSVLVAELAPDPVRVQAVSDALEVMDPDEIGQWMGVPGHGSVRQQRAQSLALVERLLKDYAAQPQPCAPVPAARALLALHDVLVRDAMIASVPLREGSSVSAFWRDLVQCAPKGFAAAPATLYALCAFAAGQGARANVGIERALDDRPGYRLAELLDLVISRGLKPDLTIPGMVSGATRERAKLLRRNRRAGRQ